MTIHPVILIGGTGTRLWPISRANYPKQFSPFFGDHSLFQECLLRLKNLPNMGKIYLVVNESCYFLCLDQLKQLDISNVEILVEPTGKNTAPAVAVAAHHIQRTTNTDSLMLVLPSDHLIKDAEDFTQTIIAASESAKNHLILFGINPSFPATGYGYIQANTDATIPAKVNAFIEKPNSENAQALINNGNCYWNSGMFFFSVSKILEAFKKHAPEINNNAQKLVSKSIQHGNTFHLSDDLFSQMPNIPLDIAIMEKTDNAYVFPFHSTWSDLGDWNAVYEGKTPNDEGNISIGNVLSLSTKNSYMHSSEKLLATIGIDNLVVIAEKDSVLIANRNHTQDVKKLVDLIKSTHHVDITKHNAVVHRPWGTYESIIQMNGFQVKHIVVKPGGTLSLQLHYQRSEHWIVVQGIADIVCGNEAFQLNANESTYIPKETKHRLVNLQEMPLHLIEVQVGDYLGEDDIVRFEDIYGRIKGSNSVGNITQAEQT